MRKRIFLTAAIVILFVVGAKAQKFSFPPLFDSTTMVKLTDSLRTILSDGVMRISGIRIRNIELDDRHQQITLDFAPGMAEYPIRKGNAEKVIQTIRHFMPSRFNHYNLTVKTDNKELEELIPAYYDPARISYDNKVLKENRKEYQRAFEINRKAPARIQPKKELPGNSLTEKTGKPAGINKHG